MNETVILQIPAKPEYVLAARLTASAVAQRFSMPIDDLEDIKMAVGEALVLLMEQQDGVGIIRIEYVREDDAFSVLLLRDEDCTPHQTDQAQAELSEAIIDALMDEMVMKRMEGGCIDSIGFMKKVG
jgi:anti-sigma regulatory factor (Ser/Thr protein kinase)